MAYYKCGKCNKINNTRKSDKAVCSNCGSNLTKRMIIKSKKQIRDKAWDAFSKYIRLRDCIKTTGSKERGVCYTCLEEFDFKDLQAGHLLTGRTDSVLFDEDNVKAQCCKCNVFKNGEQAKFFLRRVEEISKEEGSTIEEAFFKLKALMYKKENKALSIEELSEILTKYENLYKLLINEN